MDGFIPHRPERVPPEQVASSLAEQYEVADRRRTVRQFATDPVPKEAIEHALLIAGTAPSGAHKQPWTFVAIQDPAMKQRIRAAAEEEERTFYETRITDEWREALRPLGTDFVKTHLTDAPWLIVIFRQDYGVREDGTRDKHYYMTESVGIATGFLIQALHRAGLCCLTHTPSPMTFLRDICGRPLNEKPFLVLAVGYAAPDATVPDLARKPLAEIAQFM